MERYRKAFRHKVIPSYYKGSLHVLIFSMLELAAIILIGQMIEWNIYSPLYILGSLIYATTFTYFLHRFMLHRPVTGFKWAYKMHHWHHTFYKATHMEYDNLDDVYMLLMPPWLQLFYYAIYLPLLVLVLLLVFPEFIVMHFVFGFTLWYGIYELVHWIEHLSPAHILMQNKISQWLRQHHIVHHSKLKDKANFGIVEPSWDYILRTKS